VTAVSDPPPTAVPGSKFSVTDTVRNLSKFSAAASRTQYYLSLDSRKDGGSKLLSGRSVPGLGPDGISKGTVLVTIPATTLAGVYVLLACADDKGDVAEADESNNCRAAAVRVQVGRPDLVLTAVSDPPPNAVTGSSFPVTDTVQNQGVLAAGASRTQYYLSRDPLRNGGDRLLSGSRSVPSLDPDEASTGTVHVTIPVATLPGAYFVLACADARGAIAEGAETDNCRASASKVMVNR
jgi:hypothetical protein